jgi:hypothetical protein
MNLYYHLHEVAEREQPFIRESLSRFQQQYLRSKELGLNVEVKELPKYIGDMVNEKLNTSEPEIWFRISGIVLLRNERSTEKVFSGSDLLLICANPLSEIACLCKKESSHLEYGAMFPGINIAVAYYFENPYILWHEAFHLLGAEDCYGTDAGIVTDRGPTCGKSNCIMQYAITDNKIGDWPFLCEENMERVKSITGRA